MATTPPQDPRTVVRIGSRLWSDEVGATRADDLAPPYDKAYEFPGGRQFVEKTPYQGDNGGDA